MKDTLLKEMSRGRHAPVKRYKEGIPTPPRIFSKDHKSGLLPLNISLKTVPHGVFEEWQVDYKDANPYAKGECSAFLRRLGCWCQEKPSIV